MLVELETHGCHPGYVYDKEKETCLCDTANSNIVRCDNNNRYIYLSVSMKYWCHVM